MVGKCSHHQIPKKNDFLDNKGQIFIVENQINLFEQNYAPGFSSSFIYLLTFTSHSVLWPTLNGAVQGAVHKGELTGRHVTIPPCVRPALVSGTSDVKAKCDPWGQKPHRMPLPHHVFICLTPNLFWKTPFTCHGRWYHILFYVPVTCSLYFFHSPYYNILKLSIYWSVLFNRLWFSEKRGLAFFLLWTVRSLVYGSQSKSICCTELNICPKYSIKC